MSDPDPPPSPEPTVPLAVEAPAGSPPPQEKATAPSDKRRAPRHTYQIKSGGPGTHSNGEAQREVKRIIELATWTARLPEPRLSPALSNEVQYPPPGNLTEYPWVAEYRMKRLSKAKNDGGRGEKKGAARSREGSSPPSGAYRWSCTNTEDYRHGLLALFRSARGEGARDRAERSVLTEFVQIPLSWYRHVQRDYRGGQRPDHEAIQLLAFVVMKYVTGHFDGDLLLAPRDFIRGVFGFSERVEKDTLSRLLDQHLLIRVVVRGYVPWDPRGKGTYRFLLPRFDNLIGITYRA